MEGYCVRCKETRTMNNAKQVTMKNGRAAVKGVCSKCSAGMYKIGATL